MQKCGHAIMFTAQGIAFVHGGADFTRTKHGNHSSDNAGDEINRFDWQRKHAYADVVDYVAGLIELRRAQPAFRMTERDDIRRRLRFLDQHATDDRVVEPIPKPLS
jgi:pullulanase